MHQHYSFTKGQKTPKSYEQVVDKVYQLAVQQQKTFERCSIRTSFASIDGRAIALVGIASEIDFAFSEYVPFQMCCKNDSADIISRLPTVI